MQKIISKYNRILNRKQKLQIGILVIMMIISAIMETIGISMIVPLITMMMDPQIMVQNKYVAIICDVFHIVDSQQLVLCIIGCMIIVFLSKNVLQMIIYNYQYRFINNCRLKIQKKLMHSFLHRPYEFYLNAKTSEVMRIISSDTAGTFLLLSNMLELTTQLIISGAIIVTLLIIEPVMSFAIAVILLILVIIITKCIKPTMKDIGEKQLIYASNTNKWLMQFIAGIKEVKIDSSEDYFEQQYVKNATELINADRKNNILGKLPAALIETISIDGALFIFVILILNGYDVSEMLPQLSAFGVAAVKLIPSANKISNYLNAIAHDQPQLDNTIKNLHAISNENIVESCIEEKFIFEDKIELKDISYAYPGCESSVLKDANMQIKKGNAVGIVGTSGSGKTTAVDILLGLLLPQKGNVLVDGVDIKQSYNQWLSMIGYIPQTIYMLDDSIRANVAFGYNDNDIDDEKVWTALKQAQLDDYVRNLPEGLDSQIGERGVRISGGQRQRIGIARALYANPSILVFDEATSALDNETEAAIMESINALHGEKTMIIIAHRLATIENCDVVYCVEEGKISIK